MKDNFRSWTAWRTVGLLAVSALMVSCASHLREAKFQYAKGTEHRRAYQTDQALASFSRARLEAERESGRRPSAQSFMLKGLAELELNRRLEAESSFRKAFAHGFEKGEEWAEGLSLLGTAVTLERFGLEEAASGFYLHLIEKSKFRPVTILAARHHVENELLKVRDLEGDKRRAALARLFKTVQRLAGKEPSCGFYHYLQSQIRSHQEEYRPSLESAVLARELGLPQQEILRDNDNQIIFCYRQLKEELDPIQWESFQAFYMQWVRRWNWPGPEEPEWKRR